MLCFCWSGCRRREVLGDRYFDDAGAVLRKSICYRVADLLRPFT